MLHLRVFVRVVGVYGLADARVALGLLRAGEQARPVDFEHRLHEIWSAGVHDVEEIVEAGEVEESTVRQLRLVELNGRTLVANHVLLEGEEA